MTVIGIDFGSDSCVLATDQNNRIETIYNDYFERKTPSVVAFTDNNRIFGTPARKQQAANIKNTIHSFKKLFNTNPDKSFNVESRLFKFTRFNLKQITAMLFWKLKLDADAFLTPNEVTGCVLSAPSYFTKHEQNALLVAAGIAGLNCHFVIKETTAVALNYHGFYKKFPKPMNVFFIDIGQSATQVSAWKFTNSQIEVIAESSGLVGGRDFDELLMAHFVEGFGQQELSESFSALLLDETEKLKIEMSLAEAEAEMSLNIKSLLTDGSVLPSMKRSKMEELCVSLFGLIENVMQQCFLESGLMLHEVDSIEIVGASSRLPQVKKLIEKVFGKSPCGTMNQDEAVARGCTLWFKLFSERKDFKIIEKPATEHQMIDFLNGLKIRQIHSNFINHADEWILPVTEKELSLFIDIGNELADIDDEEKRRILARDKLDEVINEVEAPGGFLETLDVESRQVLGDGLSKMKLWHDGTTQEYEDKQRQLEALATRRQDDQDHLVDEYDPEKVVLSVEQQDQRQQDQMSGHDERNDNDGEVELRNSFIQPRSESSYDEELTINQRKVNTNQDFVRDYKSLKEVRHFPEMYRQMYQPARVKPRPKPRDYILQRERERENPLNVCSPS